MNPRMTLAELELIHASQLEQLAALSCAISAEDAVKIYGINMIANTFYEEIKAILPSKEPK